MFISSSTPFHIMVSFIVVMMMMIGGISPGISEAKVYNVLDFGAFSNGILDNSHAFLGAWKAACNAETESAKVVVPENTAFLVFPVTFQGPCKPEKITFTLSGTIVAPNALSAWLFGFRRSSQWLAFKDVKGLTVDGNGHVDGQGFGWWDQSCKISPQMLGCSYTAPTALNFVNCNESRVTNVVFRDSPQTHLLIIDCYRFTADNLKIQAPGDSPNTDGIHIHSSSHLNITDSVISTGDDCISVGDYTSHVEISNITCGPGHGISIGSLGRQGNFARVSDIQVSDSVFKGTTNGARIKTWQVGKGYVKKIVFKNLQFHNVKNPIIIDQKYCDVGGSCEEVEGAGVKVSDVSYMGMSGTSSTRIAINLNCSRFNQCTDILMKDIRLASAAGTGEEVVASCTNAHGREIVVVPGHCLRDSNF